MIIWMAILILALLMSHILKCDIRYHFIDIHIGACARTTLYHIHDKLIQILTRDDPITRIHNRVFDFFIKQIEFEIR